MPEDLKLMVNHVRLLRYLGRDVVQGLSSVISTIELRSGRFLFRDGDPEDKIFVVKSGRLDLRVIDEDGSTTTIHELTTGGNPYSLLAIIDAMNNLQPKYQNIEAVAVSRCSVVCLSISDLIKVCRDFPPANLRLAQMIIIRLHRVTFAALHNFFGLDKELFSQEPQTFLKESAVKSVLGRFGKSGRNAASNVPSSSHKKRKSKPAILMPAGSSTADHLIPPQATTSTGSLDEMGSLVPSNSVSKLLELGEVADGVSECSGRLSRTPSMRSTKLHDALVRAAQQDLARLFGISEGGQVLDKMVSVIDVNAGDVVIKETEIQPELYYIISGGFVLTQLNSVPGSTSTKTVAVFEATPGELIGLLGVITGEPNNCSVQASADSRVAVLPRNDFFSLVRAYPQVLTNAAHLVSLRLSPLLRQADFAIEWHGVDAGKALFKQGDCSNYVYVVLNGRFREVHTNDDGSRTVIAESGRGAFLGYVEVTSCKPRVNTVLAIRDSEVVKMPSILLNWLKQLTPNPINRFIQLLSDRLMQPSSYSICSDGFNQPAVDLANSEPLNSTRCVLQKSQLNAAGSGGVMANLRAIAILATTPEINTEAFTLEMQHAMSVFGSSIRLTSDIIKKRIGENAFEPLNDYRLCSWLSHQEDLHRMVFYIADSHRSSAWTRRCLRQADCVVVLALGSTEDPSKLSPVEQVIDSCTTKVTKILVLMYPLETEYPPAKKTASWLNARPWVTQHYHIRCPPRVLNPTVKNLITFYSQVFLVEEPNPHSDMSRLVRYLTGQAVGLVLGGGGAKGGAHVGIIRVLQEAGIPIDMVGGTSIGALIGAMWAEETRVAEFSQRSRDFALVFKSIWPKIRDLTYPTVSLFSGYEFNAYIEATFKDRQIEDLWLPYFCVTTDISNCKMRVHTSGSLWRYVRSSMTYPLLLPPLCDPRDGHLLVDGVFVNVVPADIMASFGAKTIYAVDVGSVYDTNLTNYGDWLSGWWLIYQRFFRWWGPPIRVPNFTEIQSRLAYISCIRQLEEVKSSGICHYLRPPIDRFMTLQFSAFEEIVAVGYNYGKEMLEEWQRSGAFNQMMPNTYKRVRYRSSGGHRKARSVSIGALSTSTSSVLADDATHQDPTAADSHVAETAVKRRRGSLEKMSPPPSTEADEGRHRPDFNDEWWKTWLRLHPERISKLALGSTAFDRMDDGKMLPLAEQWLYAPSKLHKSRKSTRRSKPRSRAPVLAKSVTPDSKRLVPTKGSPSDNEGDFSMDDEEGVEAVDAADDFLVTASDPELSSIRYTMATTKLSHHHRSADKGASLTEVGLSDGEITPKVAVVKAPHRRHRLRRRGSLNKVYREPLFPFTASQEQINYPSCSQ
uniref:Swiss cheese n=1 Tax=Mesocestoides corti TaxID=53468 RepID=A0A5K3F6B5_MESCO